MHKILEHLSALYGAEIGQTTFARLLPLIDQPRPSVVRPSPAALTQRDAVLITYGDQVYEPNGLPLDTLTAFCARYLAGALNTIHLLPFYPATSDDGFAVTDYRRVAAALGDWAGVARLGAHAHLMFDAVVNHVSAQSRWFQEFLRDAPRYRDYFIVVPEGADLSRVIRPRALPLLTPFTTPSGTKNVWTTFSADQVDLNYHNPDVLLEIIATLLFYVAHGARWLRLDAIAFLWKEFGTPCAHLPQTHRVIKLLRAIMDAVAPHVILLTETNVPHDDNVAYFGDGADEAHLVYNFALPPLTLYAFHTGDARPLTQWASRLTLPSNQVTFFNFLASHDGIGLNPVRGILSAAEIAALVERTLAHGGLVSYKTSHAGTTSPYELNINYFDALSDPNAAETRARQIDRFIGAHAIMLALVGVPGIYFHSLFGSRGWRAGARQTGQNRTINREKLERVALERELSDSNSLRYHVYARLTNLLRVRAAHPAFAPYGEQRLLDVSPAIFALQRVGVHGETILCLQNLSRQSQAIQLDLAQLLGLTSDNIIDLCANQTFTASRVMRVAPYQTLWLSRQSQR